MMAITTVCSGQVKVWVNFSSDMHNGVGGGANGIADWVDELDKATAAAGVTTFSAAERTTIETEVLSQLSTIYSGYDVTWTTTMPGSGVFDSLAYGMTSFGFTALGIAPTDPINISSSQVGSIATGNFSFILDEFTGSASRPTQISQLATALAGTGAHELGHTFGLFHHHAYSDSSVIPATYAATGGVQNGYIMATGPTGLTEAGREALRSLSPWERAMLDVAGGAAAAYPSLDHKKLVSSPILIDLMEDGPFDAGATPGTAMPISLSSGATSGMDLALIAADLDGSASDVDWFKITLAAPGLLTAEVFSDNRFASPFDFDPFLGLLDASGMFLIGNDDVFYSGDVYNSLVFRQDDPFLLNVPLGPGEYFLMVHASPTSSIPPGPGDAYWLQVGFLAVPEPGTLAAMTVVGMGIVLLARRTRLDRNRIGNRFKVRLRIRDL